MLKIYNNLTREKEELRPIEPGKVRMYVCGMTVYDYCHIGHARVMVVFDIVARYLRSLKFDLTYVRNVTDIDDKIIQRAKEAKEPFESLTAHYIQAMHEDEKALNVLPPDLEPHATNAMDDIIRMIQTLEEKQYAYVGSNGDVFYAVSKFKNYGRLSGKNPEELRSGTRVDIDPAKNDPLDFVLWKMAKPGEPAWDSPWGKGRPGWHIECSAMSTECLGDHFDIHGGGMDLQFPHHENEIAQSEGATGKKFVNIWMHNGFVRVNEEKMSKSLDNFFTVREVLNKIDSDVIRFFILNSHYRSPLNYSVEYFDEAASALNRLYTALSDQKSTTAGNAGIDFLNRFNAAMDDDFNTPVALSVLFDLAREINRQKKGNPELAARLAARLTALGQVLGLLDEDPGDRLKRGFNTKRAVHESIVQPGRIEIRAKPISASVGMSNEKIEKMIGERQAARDEKDWALADRIRNELKTDGVILEDVAGDTKWRRE